MPTNLHKKLFQDNGTSKYLRSDIIPWGDFGKFVVDEDTTNLDSIVGSSWLYLKSTVDGSPNGEVGPYWFWTSVREDDQGVVQWLRCCEDGRVFHREGTCQEGAEGGLIDGSVEFPLEFESGWTLEPDTASATLTVSCENGKLSADASGSITNFEIADVTEDGIEASFDFEWTVSGMTFQMACNGVVLCASDEEKKGTVEIDGCSLVVVSHSETSSSGTMTEHITIRATWLNVVEGADSYWTWSDWTSLGSTGGSAGSIGDVLITHTVLESDLGEGSSVACGFKYGVGNGSLLVFHNGLEVVLGENYFEGSRDSDGNSSSIVLGFDAKEGDMFDFVGFGGVEAVSTEPVLEFKFTMSGLGGGEADQVYTNLDAKLDFDWGDGSGDNSSMHSWDVPGTYTVTVSGTQEQWLTVTEFALDCGGNVLSVDTALPKTRITSFELSGNIGLTSISENLLVYNPQITSLDNMFSGCSALEDFVLNLTTCDGIASADDFINGCPDGSKIVGCNYGTTTYGTFYGMDGITLQADDPNPGVIYSVVGGTPNCYRRPSLPEPHQTYITIPAETQVRIDDHGYISTSPVNLYLDDCMPAADRAGTDLYIYACAPKWGLEPVFVLSANSTVPDGYQDYNSRKIGGFHCLCLSVGTISGNSLSGYATGEILPSTVWDLRYRATSENEGMFFDGKSLWWDIYFASWDGSKLVSVYGASPVHGKSDVPMHGEKFAEQFAKVKKRLPFRDEYLPVSILGPSTEQIRTGALVDTAGGHYYEDGSTRCISTFGMEDPFGAMHIWTADITMIFNKTGSSTTYQYGGTKTSSTSYEADGYGYNDESKIGHNDVDGDRNCFGSGYGDVMRMIAGMGGNKSAVYAGHRAFYGSILSAFINSDICGRGVSEMRPVTEF